MIIKVLEETKTKFINFNNSSNKIYKINNHQEFMINNIKIQQLGHIFGKKSKMI